MYSDLDPKKLTFCSGIGQWQPHALVESTGFCIQLHVPLWRIRMSLKFRVSWRQSWTCSKLLIQKSHASDLHTLSKPCWVNIFLPLQRVASTPHYANPWRSSIGLTIFCKIIFTLRMWWMFHGILSVPHTWMDLNNVR